LNAKQAGATKVSVTAEETPEHVLVDIADDGSGLADKARRKLFEPFAGSTRDGGTGLGLVIARDIMRGHGGDIVLVDSGPGGTTFRLMLPAAEAGP